MSRGTLGEHQTSMRRVMAFLLLASLAAADVPSPKPAHPERRVSDPAFKKYARKGGSWYMSADGHAVFCYGPTMLIPKGNGDLTKVVTFCRGDREIVPLHD